MGRSNTNTYKKKANIKSYDSLVYILPLIFAAAIAPLIVYLKQVPLDELSKQYWKTDVNNDFFSYYKSVVITISASAALLLYIYRSFKYRTEFKKVNIYIPIAIYAFFVILSTLISKYPTVSIYGFADRFEGVFALISYIILMLEAVNFINNEKQIRLVLLFVYISAFIIGVIGLFQFFGFDLFSSSFGRMLILPMRSHNFAKELIFNFGAHTIFSTLYNTNFVGSYMAMLFPITLVTFILVKDKRIKVPAGLLAVLMFFNLIGCQSRAGYVGGAVALLIAAIFLRKELVKNIKVILGALGGLILILIITNYVSGGIIVHKIASISEDLAMIRKSETAQEFGLKDIQLNGKKVSIIGKQETLNMELRENNIYFFDAQKNDAEVDTDENGNIAFKDEKLKYITIKKDTEPNIFEIQFDGKVLPIFVRPEGFSIIGLNGVILDTLEPVERFGFEGMETLGSSRGYIWSRSIPLLKKNILVGSGPDTFPFVFPQYDIAGKLLGFNTANYIVDKPHSYYLQVGINTGVVSLIAIITVFLLYILSCIKLYINRQFTNTYEIAGVAIFAAVCGYLGAAFFNDSIVSVAPVFWVLLGVGISCNYYNMKSASGANVKKQGAI